jgi:serine/threonine protein phosphatase 1
VKLFVTADIHSFFTPFKEALDIAGFAPDNPEHLLVVLGDCFDRGSESVEVFKYLDSLTNVILIRGNHEDLLEDIWQRGGCLSHDRSNGTLRTVNDIFYKHTDFAPYTPIKVSEKVLQPFINKFVNYYETANYIFVHSWIPCKVFYSGYEEPKPWYLNNKTYEYMPNWREASEIDWSEARWGNPFKMAATGLNKTGKTVVFGHWGTYENRPADYDGEDLFDPFYGDGFIGLDATTALSGQVNVIVLEDELL